MDFPSGQATFTSATQIQRYQTMQFFGTEKVMTIEIPFNAPADQPCRILINEGDLAKPDTQVITTEICDQYTLQGDAFSQAILQNTEVPVPLEDSFNNMTVIEAIFRAGKSEQWEKP